MTTSISTIGDADRARDLIELGIRQLPYCRQCGEPTMVVEHGRDLWLECAVLVRPRHPLMRLVTGALAFAHDRRLLVEASAA